MYELRTAITAEPSLREVRQRALPSYRHQRLHVRALRLPAETPAARAHHTLIARIGATMSRWFGRAAQRAERGTAA